MKHYSFYSGGILQEEVNSKNIARKLISGEINGHDKVLDMETGLWVPVARQRDIMVIYQHMSKITKKKSLFEEFMYESTADCEQMPVDPFLPDRVILGFIPIYSLEQICYYQAALLRFFASIFKAYFHWRDQDSNKSVSQ